MPPINICKAISRLVQRALRGESLAIAEAGKLLVEATALDVPEPVAQRPTGFLDGQINVPADFDTMGRGGIERAFEGNAR